MEIKYDVILGMLREKDSTGSGTVDSSTLAGSGLTSENNKLNVKIDNSTIKFSGDTTIYVESEEFWHTVPTTSGSTGAAGDFAYNSTYLYVCVATNTWKRIAYDSW